MACFDQSGDARDGVLVPMLCHAGVHLDVNKRKTLKDRGDAFFVGADLFSRQNVVDSSEQMSTLDDLKAAIFASRRINCHQKHSP
jgi:hypothetical protein